MTKLEELKAAYAAATPDEWAVKQEREYKACNSRVLCDKGYIVAEGYSSDSATTKTYNELWAEAEGNANFIALAHNLMPQLLEAVELLKELRNSLSQYDDGEWYLHDGTEPRLDYIDEVLEKLK